MAKINGALLEELKRVLTIALERSPYQTFEQLLEQYRKTGLGEGRARWDLYNAAHHHCPNFYKQHIKPAYRAINLNDDHISTALRRIIK